jgi:hypothetical protein
VSAIAVDADMLYVSFGLANAGVSANHTLHRSNDRGASFTPVDEGLLDCSGQPCGYLSVRQIETAPGRLFVEAGGNILVSDDDGATWNLLFDCR